MVKESLRRLIKANYLLLDTINHHHTVEIDELLNMAFDKINTVITALHCIEEEEEDM